MTHLCLRVSQIHFITGNLIAHLNLKHYVYHDDSFHIIFSLSTFKHVI